MLRRIFWFAVGIAIGAKVALAVSRWVAEQRRKISPANVGSQAARGVGDLGETIVAVASEFREASAAREAELRASLEG